ncbi:Aminodeoxychorismate/anthranilate synthase component 2 [Enhygromyxa salina]|uniref:Aminodeoxychorismate/anthranilate synthase component 2 n=1 Tax=Enhygromyxa salina TaxID=215803 RepID=A0A2S9YAH9_9BACT|nr:aminodeoxychorismate/anthranilate synthase component II [Enhygromyxa salina]PRQ02117.1 Aminodeoxychorismate/anthranilate synthase component 2 [Enhygromyxa salina]
MPYRLLILDNYDSFAYNIYQALGELTQTAAKVYRNDRVSLAEVLADDPTHVFISPGPGNPEDPAYFGICAEVVKTLGPRQVPILGVCLGHQGLGAALGARVTRAPQVMHGKQSTIEHDGQGLFAGLPCPLTVMRYHSLMLDEASLPPQLAVTSRTREGLVMSVAHREQRVAGVQFHPESIGTEHGAELLRNFLAW